MNNQINRIHEQLQREFQDETFVTNELTHMQKFDVECGWKRLQSRMANADENASDVHLDVVENENSDFNHLFVFVRVAAVVLFVAGLGWLWYRNYTNVTPIKMSNEVALAIKESALNHKIGAKVAQLSEETMPPKVAQFIKESEQIDDDVKDELLHAMNVETYINKEYWLTLPDGSIVHLAPNSRLIYPSTFHRFHRDVYLEGEAYFMVAHSKGSNFRVYTVHGDIKDYGTEFDVDTRGKHGMRVVLIEGSVSVTPLKGAEEMMTPGEMVDMNDTISNKKIIDVTPYVAWKLGKVEFQNWKLERLMAVIEKWYGVTVSYNDESTRDMKVSGNFDRYSDLLPTLNALSTITGLNFTISNENVVIK